MLKRLVAVAVMALGMSSAAQAAIIDIDAFIAPTVIDFETAAEGQIGSQYADQGITFTNFELGFFATTPGAPSAVALNYVEGAPDADGEMTFASAITRFGFDASTNEVDDTIISAYLGDTLVGSEFFDTFGGGSDGSFLGIQFLSGFDRVVVRTVGLGNGAIALDMVRFEGVPAVDVPEPAALSLVGLGLLGLAASRRRRRA